jgi:hypothetical protein
MGHEKASTTLDLYVLPKKNVDTKVTGLLMPFRCLRARTAPQRMVSRSRASASDLRKWWAIQELNL